MAGAGALSSLLITAARHGLTADEFSALQCEGSQLLLERAVSLGRAIADEKGEKSGQR